VKQIILGTAGHIDHGKTSLIRTLTGINTDRLKEEQKRGITIELGFASMDLPSGQHLGIVDVPGHEKFVKNMVAGATGIDLVAMVIAADEGVMPQTREHMEICSLLGIRFGIVVLTKIDMVETEWLELVTEEIREFMSDTFLKDAPICAVSSTTGDGLKDFVKELDTLSDNVTGRSASGLFRLPVDRVFTMKGFGTVITGTLFSGKIEVGEQVAIYPSGITSKVRGIQVHNQPVERAEVGQRTAINFQGLEKTAVHRGDVVARPGSLVPSYMVDVSLQYLSSNPKAIKNRSKVRFHTGTSEIMGKLVFMDREELQPGEETVAQVRLDAPVTILKDDRYVLRSYSPVRTIGGGRILTPVARKHKGTDADAALEIETLADGDPSELIDYHVRSAWYKGASFTELLVLTNLSDKKLEASLQPVLSDKSISIIDKAARIYIHREVLSALENRAMDHLDRYHKANPLKEGMPKEELKSKVPPVVSDRLFHLMLNELTRKESVQVDGDQVRRTGHTVTLEIDQADAREKILSAYDAGGFTPPYFKDVASSLGMPPARAKEVLSLLVKEKQLVKVKEELYYSTAIMKDIEAKLVDFLKQNSEISMPQFKDLIGTSRKYSVPLMEYFDSNNVTLRVGDARRLRKKGGRLDG
jgi:selenocysteine-specific elongation factor